MLRFHISIPVAVISATHLCTLALKHHLHKAPGEQNTPPPLSLRAEPYREVILLSSLAWGFR